MALLSGTNVFTATNNFAGVLVATNAGNQIAGTLVWNMISGTTVTATANAGYALTNDALVTVTLLDSTQIPSGRVIRIAGSGAAGWKIAAQDSASNPINITGANASNWINAAGVARGSTLELLHLGNGNFIVIGFTLGYVNPPIVIP